MVVRRRTGERHSTPADKRRLGALELETVLVERGHRLLVPPGLHG
jgi:hypothetical protein